MAFHVDRGGNILQEAFCTLSDLQNFNGMCLGWNLPHCHWKQCHETIIAMFPPSPILHLQVHCMMQAAVCLEWVLQKFKIFYRAGKTESRLIAPKTVQEEPSDSGLHWCWATNCQGKLAFPGAPHELLVLSQNTPWVHLFIHTHSPSHKRLVQRATGLHQTTISLCQVLTLCTRRYRLK